MNVIPTPVSRVRLRGAQIRRGQGRHCRNRENISGVRTCGANLPSSPVLFIEASLRAAVPLNGGLLLCALARSPRQAAFSVFLPRTNGEGADTRARTSAEGHEDGSLLCLAIDVADACVHHDHVR